MRGFVHILKATSGGAAAASDYTVVFAPIGPTGTGGPVPNKKLRGKDGLVDFLRQMGINQDRIQDALQDLETNGNASIPFVDLPEDELQTLISSR